MWKKKKFLTMEEQVAKLSSKCRELTEEESRMLNGGGSNDYGGYNNWSEYAYAMSHETAGDANKTWMPEKKETSSTNTDSTSSSPKNTGNGTNGNQSSLSETTITPTEDGNTDSIMGTTSSTNTGSQSSTTPKTPGYYSNTCTAAMLAEYKGKLEAEKAARDSVWDYYTKAGCPYKYSVAPNLFNQHQFTKDYGFNDYEENGKIKKFEDTACNATAAVNIFSMQYTKETGKKLDFEDAVEVLTNAVKTRLVKSNAEVTDLAPVLNSFIDYIESKYDDKDIFNGYFGYSNKDWMKNNYKLDPDNIQITESYQIDINNGRTVLYHYTNDFGASVIGDDYRVIFDTYDGNIKAKEIIDTRKTNYFSIIKKDY